MDWSSSAAPGVCVLAVITLGKLSQPQVGFAAGVWVSWVRDAEGEELRLKSSFFFPVGVLIVGEMEFKINQKGSLVLLRKSGESNLSYRAGGAACK